MINSMVKNRWLLALRGVLAIVFGVLAFVWPGLTALSLVVMVAFYLTIDGVVTLIASFRHRETNDRWWLGLLEGVIGIVAGIYAFLNPVSSALAMVILLGIWAVVTGVLEIASAIRLRREIDNEWTLGLMGLLSVALGVVLFLNPGAGLMSVVWAIGGYAILFGLLMLYFAIAAPKMARRPSGDISSTDGGARSYGA